MYRKISDFRLLWDDNKVLIIAQVNTFVNWGFPGWSNTNKP